MNLLEHESVNRRAIERVLPFPIRCGGIIHDFEYILILKGSRDLCWRRASSLAYFFHRRH